MYIDIYINVYYIIYIYIPIIYHVSQFYPNYIISEFLSQFLSQLFLSIPCKSPKKIPYAMVVAPIPDHLGCPTATSSGDSTCKAESGLGDHGSSSVLMFWMPILSKHFLKTWRSEIPRSRTLDFGLRSSSNSELNRVIWLCLRKNISPIPMVSPMAILP